MTSILLLIVCQWEAISKVKSSKNHQWHDIIITIVSWRFLRGYTCVKYCIYDIILFNFFMLKTLSSSFRLGSFTVISRSEENVWLKSYEVGRVWTCNICFPGQPLHHYITAPAHFGCLFPNTFLLYLKSVMSKVSRKITNCT